MALETHTVTLDTEYPGGEPLDGTWSVSVWANPPLMKDTADHNVIAGKDPVTTVDGVALLELEATGQANLDPPDALWQISFVSRDRNTRLGPYVFDLTEDRTLDEIVEASGFAPITPTLVSQAEAARDAAQAAAASAAGIAPLNVTSFGAVGNGATEDTAAIHAARNAAGAGGRLYFPPGVYRTAGLVASVANQVWEFAPGAVVKLADAAALGTTLAVTAAGVTLVAPGVDGNRANQTAGAGGISVTAPDCTIVRPRVTATRGAAVAAYASGLVLEGGELTGFGSASGGGVWVKAAVGQTITGTRITGTKISTTDTDVDGLAMSGTVAADNVTVTSWVEGARITDVDITLPAASANICLEVWGGCPRTVLTGVAVRGGVMGISLDRSDYSTVSGFTITGGTYCGLELAVSSYVAVGPGVIDGAGVCGEGVSVSSPVATKPHHNSLTGVVIRNWAPTGFAVHAMQTDHLGIAGGILDGPNQPVNLQACTDTTVSGVAVDGRGTVLDAINFDAGSGGIVTGCTFDACTRAGVFIWNGAANVEVGPNRRVGGTPVIGVIYAGSGAGNVVNAGRGTTATRPTAPTVGDGGTYYDQTLNKPLWSDGAAWRDSAGTAA